MVGNTAFIFARVATLALGALFYIYGLSKINNQSLDYEMGSFNIPAIRFTAFGLVALFQAYLIYAFIKRQRQRARDSGAVVTSKVKAAKNQRPKKKDGIYYSKILISFFFYKKLPIILYNFYDINFYLCHF